MIVRNKVIIPNTSAVNGFEGEIYYKKPTTRQTIVSANIALKYRTLPPAFRGNRAIFPNSCFSLGET